MRSQRWEAEDGKPKMGTENGNPKMQSQRWKAEKATGCKRSQRKQRQPMGGNCRQRLRANTSRTRPPESRGERNNHRTPLGFKNLGNRTQDMVLACIHTNPSCRRTALLDQRQCVGFRPVVFSPCTALLLQKLKCCPPKDQIEGLPSRDF